MAVAKDQIRQIITENNITSGTILPPASGLAGCAPGAGRSKPKV